MATQASERTMDDIDYTITPIPASQGGGWMLNVFVDHKHTGGGCYPAPKSYDHVVDAWWHRLRNEARLDWLERGGTGDRSDAHHAFVLAKLFDRAEQTGKEWMISRGTFLHSASSVV